MKEHFLKLLLPMSRIQTLQISKNPKEHLSTDRVRLFASILSVPWRACYSARTLHQVKLPVRALVFYYATSFASVPYCAPNIFYIQVETIKIFFLPPGWVQAYQLCYQHMTCAKHFHHSYFLSVYFHLHWIFLVKQRKKIKLKRKG